MDKRHMFFLDQLIDFQKCIHVKIEKDFFKKMLISASGDIYPHKNIKLLKKLEMGLTKSKDSSMTLYGWTKYDKTIPLRKLILISKLAKVPWDTVEKMIISLKGGSNNHGEIFPSLPFNASFKIGSIIGHILGDGSIDSRYSQVFYSNSNKVLLKEFFNHMNSIFGIKPRIWMQERPDFGKTKWDKKLNSINELVSGRNCGLFYPTICGRLLNEFFDNFAVGFDKKIPHEFFNFNKDFKRGLIRAFYDDEGSIPKNGKNIRLFQDRKEILEAFRLLLLDFNIIPSGIKVYTKRNKERYYFDIFRKSNFGKFQIEIGFTSLEKKKRLKRLTVIKNLKNSK